MTFFCIPFTVLYLLGHVKIGVCICMYSILNKILFTLNGSLKGNRVFSIFMFQLSYNRFKGYINFESFIELIH